MSRKKILILIVILLLVAGGVWFYFSLQNTTGEPKEGGLKSLFPFSDSNKNTGKGGTGGDEKTNKDSENGTTEEINPVYDPLIQISKKPNTGMTFIDTTPTKTATTSTSSAQNSVQAKIPTVRFMEKGTGYIYDVSARAENEIQKTNTNIVKVTKTLFGDNGTSVILRYLKNDNVTIITFLGKVMPPVVSGEGVFGTIKGDFLSENIIDLVMSPRGDNFSYLIATNSGTEGINLHTDKSGKKTLFMSSFDEWLLNLTDGGLMATTKASSEVLGYAYLIQPSGTFQRILGKINGLTTTLSPEGNAVLYSETFGSTVGLFIKNFSDSKAIKTGLSTFPEKCVWNSRSTTIYCAVPNFIPTGNYPDDWFQGSVHFSDSLYKIEADSGKTTYLKDMQEHNIDAVNLAVDSTEKFLIFQNKNDSTSWSFDLTYR